ncbi:hypothetical protein AB1Y20_018678 [Prymnesium parvum]|uniref:Uncharacterized protein n=1 Tax=Prymnesium parvum TaxID=97485 RepID=A0AB34JQU3_PRYPA
MEEECAFSQVIERHCATDEEGRLRCQTIRKLYKHCPGRHPEEVIEREDETGASLDGRGQSDAWVQPRVPGRHFEGGGELTLHDFRSLQDDFVNQMNSIFRIFGFDGFGKGFGGGLFESTPPPRARAEQQPDASRPHHKLKIDEI